MNNKFKSYKFWLAVFGGVLIIVQNIFKVNGIVITDEVGYNIINAVCGILVFLGVIDKPKQNGNGANGNHLGKNNKNKNTKNKNNNANNVVENEVVDDNENAKSIEKFENDKNSKNNVENNSKNELK